ncbi:alpha/beta hydrolase [Neorhodopirellula pilleata]|uniref:Acetylxylan esterase n=1 Tax=Neorhodopirellula pilleata TaxID=2714738 RepID=A0A5C5ZL61_9BACT|nr:alpha/beta hydrolase [Neorhodopirellula pilleata]TWT87905.1 Acetylxylan esterase precursor [Neorhodopirellula pilleata]
MRCILPRRRTFNISVALLLAILLHRTEAALFAETPIPRADHVVQIWPGEPPAWKATEEAERDLSDAKSNLVAGAPIIRLGHVRNVELHVFEAADATGKPSNAAVIIAPGGGYTILAWDLEGIEVAKQLQAGGVTAIVLKYRVPTGPMGDEKWKPAVQDIQRSIALVRDGKVTSSTPQHVGAMGFSAGGNAVARTATSKTRHYESVDASDETIRRPDFACLVYPAWLVEKEQQDQMIEGIEVDSDTPPMFFAHGEDDPHAVLNSVTMFRQLHAAGVPSALHVFTGSGHGFGARLDGRADDLWPELCIRWIRDNGWIAASTKSPETR